MPALRTRDTQSRSLEVTTDTPQPPTLAIISPTPRAFTFPSVHNLADSPYSSPSHSPFDPDQLNLHSLPSQCTIAPLLTTPPPQFQRTLSPISSTPDPSTSPSPAPRPSQSHQRRKSSVCSINTDEERRPRKGDSDYIKRPENAFILFRRKCCEERQAAANDEKLDGPTKKQRQADLSKTISQQWKSLTPEERKVWEDKAKERKKEHEAMYPNYVYRPQRSKDRARGKKAGKAGKGDTEHETDPENVAFVLPMPAQRHGRSASAPTPPPYQAILLPNIYQMAPSCPTSPSLLPMINRHASQTGQPGDCVNHFDFLPHENFMPPPSFGQNGHFEASLQSSEFLRNIFAMPNLPSSTHKDDLSLPVPTNELLPSNKSISPVSSAGSSGPSSPASGPYTPVAAIANQSFTQQLAGMDLPIPDLRQGELEIPNDMQLHQDLASYTWDSTNIWPTDSTILLGDDFDLNAIPSIELGNGKFNENYAEPASTLQFGQEFASALEGREYSQDTINTMIGFDDMMAGPRF
ncbi:Repressor ROX1 [Leucoagaricus sp. SymC.cos]|nr:Repressor ROX1 [Leucoagaricus sp. SymC.cos]